MGWKPPAGHKAVPMPTLGPAGWVCATCGEPLTHIRQPNAPAQWRHKRGK